MCSRPNSLADQNSQLAAEWHPTLNGQLSPHEVTQGSSRKVWWICGTDNTHEWKATIASRSRGNGCPFCAGLRVTEQNSLASLNPSLAAQWHPTKNGALSPKDVSRRSGKKVWWKCNEGPDHVWQAVVSSRDKGAGCSICSGKTVVNSNSLARLNPQLALQWHPTKNGDLTPMKVTEGSNKKVWWLCEEADDHEWEATVARRSQGTGCPMCSNKIIVKSNCLATVNPDLAAELHPTLNGNLSAFDLGPSGTKKVWWQCLKYADHIWENSAYQRTKDGGRGCPYCAGKRVSNSNSLSALYPELVVEWHPTKNSTLSPKNFTIGSNKTIWWKCPKGDDHEWKATIEKRVGGGGCPICSGRKVTPSTSLASINPELAKEWHPTKNGSLTPYDVAPSSRKEVWWQCPKQEDHVWKRTVDGRAGCPFCRNLMVAKSNCLSTTHPQLAAEWHPTKNGKTTPDDVTVGSHKKAWWKCAKGDDHEWSTVILYRGQGDGCPICRGLKVVTSNCLQTTHPRFASEWHPTKNGAKSPRTVTAGHNKKVWWQCQRHNDHEWRTSVSSRTGQNAGCPYCTLTPQSRQELTITFELLKFFKDINPRGFKTRVKGRLKSIDIFIPELNLGIEFDGSYWHKDKRAIDRLKTEQLKEEGFEIIRVREEPLRKISEADIVSSKPFNGKEVTNSVLLQIMRMFPIKGRLQARIERYIAKDGLQNEKALDAYIEEVLEEKAAKKDSKSN